MDSRNVNAAKCRRVIRSLFMVVLFGVSVPSLFAETVEYDQAKLAEIKVLLDGLYENGQIPNYAVEIRKNGKSVYAAYRGDTELGGSVPVGPDTIFWVASMGKPIVSSAVLKLIQDGDLSLDDPLSKFFPQFESMVVAPMGDLDVPFEIARAPITIRNLLTHTSGFTYNPLVLGLGDVAYQYAELEVMSQKFSLEENLEMLAQIPLVAQPGASFNYSVSVDVLGAIIEKVTGKRLGEYLDEIFFKPMGMTDTAFRVRPEARKRFARFYTPESLRNPASTIAGSEIEWQIVETAPFGLPYDGWGQAPTFDSGGGGLYSTAQDFLKYAEMVANGGVLNDVRYLSAEIAAIHFQDLMPELGLEAFEVAFGEAAQYMKFGGGFGIKLEEDGSDRADYYFWGGAANTFFWIDGQDGNVGVFFTHIWPPRYNLSDQIEALVDEARIVK
ncbi:beta-lactamase family protein [Pseudomonadales bacterium]|nr:beta-lactamase family protein [Pseudomonadales bacterium]